jgi:hypothetical protein
MLDGASLARGVRLDLGQFRGCLVSLREAIRVVPGADEREPPCPLALDFDITRS